MFLFISGAEIFVILLIVVMLFGADKLPEIARGLGKGMRQVKDATNDIKREIKNSAEKNDFDIDVASKVKDEINKVRKGVDDFTRPASKIKDDIIDDITGPIKRNKK
jgi:sec-independent protein translocase protein TatA